MSITAIIDAGGEIVLELDAGQGLSGPPGAASPLTLPASEDLAAGDWVNVWDDAGTARVRQATAADPARSAHGFVLAAVASGNSAMVYVAGMNDAASGQSIGAVYLQTAPGLGGSAAPSASGQIVQRLGTALTATTVIFQPHEPIRID